MLLINVNVSALRNTKNRHLILIVVMLLDTRYSAFNYASRKTFR